MDFKFPIQIESTNHTCTNRCQFQIKLNLSLSSCQVSISSTDKKHNQLNIFPGNTNYIFFNEERKQIQKMIITNVKHKFIDTVEHAYELMVLAGDIIIFVPIIVSPIKSASSIFFESILPFAQQNTKSVVNVSNFTLDKLIPKSSYYYYKADDVDCVVFDKNNNGYITIQEQIKKYLDKQLNIKEFQKMKYINESKLFYHKHPWKVYEESIVDSNGNKEDDIYIDCSETNDEIENKEDIPKDFWYWLKISVLVLIPFLFLILILFDITPMKVILAVVIVYIIAFIIGAVVDITS